MIAALDSQLLIENRKLVSLSDKLEHTAQWMMASHGTPEFGVRQDTYFPLLKKWRNQSKLVNGLRSQIAQSKMLNSSKPVKSDEAISMEEKRAQKEASVTSTTYERAQKRLFKSVDGFLSGKH
ncbi:hypothetical protein A1QO_02685 [Vibrio genomosp. F10 str. ZF-129]|uniref:Uncharacterized protein n=1 Tax=Vibrio genomosp. F10 str. ZF-129 TaxID=1187848 RepID=A0A1E5BKB8_9VIBR|nr:hypothetical protein [Vibrio genomosp. F10]OEE38304.1 hypothetical protein A1QO_02685 [Vibrio genomosp. F10 str. ZF-129]